MIYLDSGATSFHKPRAVYKAVQNAMNMCASPGRGGYLYAANADKIVFECRERLGKFFDCDAEKVVFTSNCTHSLNIAIRSLIKPGAAVVVSGFEHNAVIRPLYALGAKIHVVGRRLFDHQNILEEFEQALKNGVDAAVFTHVSNVFGYILPIDEMSELCKMYHTPFVIDVAQSAGYLPISMTKLGADFIAAPGHKGLLGPQGTGVLLCKDECKPFIYGGTGSLSRNLTMPEYLPDRLEAGTLNVPGIAGLNAGVAYIQRNGVERIKNAVHERMLYCVDGLKKIGLKPFEGEHQLGTISFVPDVDVEEFAQLLSERGICVRSGLHCAPLAHESAGTLESGTVRISVSHNNTFEQLNYFLKTVGNIVN